jgi:hypothetical protein
MSSPSIAQSAPRHRPPFAPYNKHDHNFFLLWVLLIWVGIVMGFGSDMLRHVRSHEAAYPLIVHVHAVAFVSFLVLLTVQVLLIRGNRPDIHRKLGIAGVCLAAAMLFLGPAAAIVVQRAQFGTPDSDPAFLAIQLAGIISFAGLITAATIKRHDAPAHKRLILLAVLAIADAGFARWLGGDLGRIFGDGLIGFWISSSAGNFVLVIGIGIYDLITRGRLHPAYVAGATWLFAWEVVEDILYHSPAWKQVALHIIAH